MKYLIAFCAVLASVLLLSVEGAISYHFWVALGKTQFDQLVYGGLGISSVLMVSICPILGKYLTRQKKYALGYTAYAMAAVFFIGSLTSAIGFHSTNRAVANGERTVTETLVTSNVDGLKADQDELKTVRSDLRRKLSSDRRLELEAKEKSLIKQIDQKKADLQFSVVSVQQNAASIVQVERMAYMTGGSENAVLAGLLILGTIMVAIGALMAPVLTVEYIRGFKEDTIPAGGQSQETVVTPEDSEPESDFSLPEFEPYEPQSRTLTLVKSDTSKKNETVQETVEDSVKVKDIVAFREFIKIHTDRCMDTSKPLAERSVQAKELLDVYNRYRGDRPELNYVTLGHLMAAIGIIKRKQGVCYYQGLTLKTQYKTNVQPLRKAA